MACAFPAGKDAGLDLAVGNNMPEPTTLLLFGAALLAVGAVRKKNAQ